MSRRGHLLIALALVVGSVAAVAFAARTSPSSVGGGGTAAGSGRTAPELHAEGWINTPPLTPADLTGKVVLYDFWTYSCVNCVRTIPYIRSWYDRYRDDGLVIIGVHSPEFDFEKDHANVQRAVKKLGVDYPVALDDNMVIWNAFANQYWPADYLYDRRGHEASVHFGEGDYDKTENEIRGLLGVTKGSPRAKVGKQIGGPDGSADITPETYNGAERGQAGFASPEPLDQGVDDFTAPGELARDQHALVGRWDVEGQYVQAAEPGAQLRLHYMAGAANLVMATADGRPVDVRVQVDDRPPTTVRVQAADLYTLVADDHEGDHLLTLTATRPGLRAFAFTFGG
jgi:thiol-disulfide isomerase/thioredoxin